MNICELPRDIAEIILQNIPQANLVCKLWYSVRITFKNYINDVIESAVEFNNLDLYVWLHETTYYSMVIILEIAAIHATLFPEHLTLIALRWENLYIPALSFDLPIPFRNEFYKINALTVQLPSLVMLYGTENNTETLIEAGIKFEKNSIIYAIASRNFKMFVHIINVFGIFRGYMRYVFITGTPEMFDYIMIDYVANIGDITSVISYGNHNLFIHMLNKYFPDHKILEILQFVAPYQYYDEVGYQSIMKYCRNYISGL